MKKGAILEGHAVSAVYLVDGGQCCGENCFCGCDGGERKGCLRQLVEFRTMRNFLVMTIWCDYGHFVCLPFTA